MARGGFSIRGTMPLSIKLPYYGPTNDPPTSHHCRSVAKAAAIQVPAVDGHLRESCAKLRASLRAAALQVTTTLGKVDAHVGTGSVHNMNGNKWTSPREPKGAAGTGPGRLRVVCAAGSRRSPLRGLPACCAGAAWRANPRGQSRRGMNRVPLARCVRERERKRCPLSRMALGPPEGCAHDPPKARCATMARGTSSFHGGAVSWRAGWVTRAHEENRTVALTPLRKEGSRTPRPMPHTPNRMPEPLSTCPSSSSKTCMAQCWGRPVSVDAPLAHA